MNFVRALRQEGAQEPAHLRVIIHDEDVCEVDCGRCHASTNGRIITFREFGTYPFLQAGLRGKAGRTTCVLAPDVGSGLMGEASRPIQAGLFLFRKANTAIDDNRQSSGPDGSGTAVRLP